MLFDFLERGEYLVREVKRCAFCDFLQVSQLASNCALISALQVPYCTRYGTVQQARFIVPSCVKKETSYTYITQHTRRLIGPIA